MQHDWFMYHLRSSYKNRLEYPFNLIDFAVRAEIMVSLVWLGWVPFFGTFVSFGGGGGRALPLLTVVGMCRWTGYEFPVITSDTGSNSAYIIGDFRNVFKLMDISSA